MTSIVWFCQDLRTRDNPAIAAAAARGRVLPVFILDDATSASQWQLGGASRWWLHHSLTALRDDVGHLALFRGDPCKLLPALIKKVGASAVYFHAPVSTITMPIWIIDCQKHLQIGQPA